jgi:hypothetical protein
MDTADTPLEHQETTPFGLPTNSLTSNKPLSASQGSQWHAHCRSLTGN